MSLNRSYYLMPDMVAVMRHYNKALTLMLTIMSINLSSCNSTPALAQSAVADSWSYLGEFKATAYCSCKLCCGKNDGITASGRKVSVGTIACNWLPFGTKLRIEPRASNSKIEALWHYPIGTVLDRGAKSLFGSKYKHIKHIDLWMDSHSKALRWGSRQVDVWVI